MASVKEVNAGNWEHEVLGSDILTVVDFWHERCPWCLKLNPILEEVAEEYKDKIKFVNLNVLKNAANQEIAIRHGIMSTPTLTFFCEGKSVGHALGFVPKERLIEMLANMLEKHRDCIRQSTELKT